MSKTRPSNFEIKTSEDLKKWFEKKPDSFCYVTGKVRQNWYIGHNNLIIDGKNVQLEFRDRTGGLWIAIVKENKQDGEKKEGSEGN